MKQNIARDAENYMKNHRKKGRWYKLVTGLACIVVFCTTYALILPAITLEGNQCGIEEHTHTDECYTQVTSITRKVPVCTVEGLDIHVHSEKCYDDQKNLICGYADFVAHKHDASCYREDGTLWCPLEEREPHVHDESCYTLPEPHVHTDECYTLERGELTCTEHVHTDECYTETTGLTCGLEESEGHHHDESCHDAEGNLICGQEESEGHHHSESCYGPVRTLNCGHEGDHQHTDACYEQKKVLTCELSTDPVTEPVLVCDKEEILLHTHTAECYDKDGKRVCGQVEIKEHKHTDACFQAEEIPVDTEALTCTLPEDENHTHTARCYGTWELTCGKEEHTHTLACYADPEADLETEADWKQPFADLTLTGKWREDLLSLAKTQLGYAESERNYIVLEDGETTKGYTRYGAWQDDPYMDWNAAFVSFCLHYAGVTEIPVSADCAGWPGALGEQYAPADAREPVPGDLVFFDRDSDGSADHVGILLEVTEGTEEEPAVLTTIEGDAENAVAKCAHSAEEVLGYGILPEQAKTFTLTGKAESGITVTVTGDSTSLPCLAGDVKVVVRDLDESEQQELDAKLAENEENQESLESEEEEPEVRYLLDISLWQGENEIEPSGPVTVTLSGLETEGLYPQVYHIDTEANTSTDMEAVKDEDGNISLETSSFSPFKVIMRAAPVGTGVDSSNFGTIINGGNYYLTADIEWDSSLVFENNTTTLDLNGHCIKYSGGEGQSFLVVKGGGNLTIKDSEPSTDTEVRTFRKDEDILYGHAAELKWYNDNPSSLTYYVTRSTAAGTTTDDTCEVRIATFGGMIRNTNNAYAIVYVEGGTLNLEGGLLTNGNYRVIENSGGTVNIKGGYIAGANGGNNWGGGIYSQNNGKVNMTGGVIAANQAKSGGGIALDGGTFNMSGGCISGNRCNCGVGDYGNGEEGMGAGVFSNGAGITLSGNAYITNNRNDSHCNVRGSGCHGGGGIATRWNNTLNMSGGYVTGNYSNEAGGGLYISHVAAGSSQLVMTGGTVAANYADTGEGGGIRVSQTGVAHINGGYITNNETYSDFDWGGGGIFIQEGGKAYIHNALITRNTAAGFGGGVGACPTGETLVVHMDGSAIYDNTISGTYNDLGNGKYEHMSGGGLHGDKNADNNVAVPDYNNNYKTADKGYQDYFLVRPDDNNSDISVVTGRMLGDGAANWTGSCDENSITISETGFAAAKYLFGLTSHPEDDAKAAAVNAATVFITGNKSRTHGGGIMTNGELTLGNPGTVVDMVPSLNIKGTKVLLEDGVAQSSGRNFNFELLDESKNNVIGRATADGESGEFTIAPDSKQDYTDTNRAYTYYLREAQDGQSGVTYDLTQYKIQVRINRSETTVLGTKFVSYSVGSAEVWKIDEEGNETKLSGSTGSGTGSGSTGGFRIHFQNSQNWSQVALHLFSYNNLLSNWDGEWRGWPGQLVAENPDNSGWYTVEFNVSDSNTFKFIFNNNGNGSQTDNTEGKYEVGTELWATWNGERNSAASVSYTKPSNWIGGPPSSGGGGDTPTPGGDFIGSPNPDGSYTVALQGATFTNTKTVTTSVSLKLVKKDSNDATKLLKDAKFQLKEAVEAGKTGYDEEGTTDAKGEVTFAGLKENTTYYLWETQAPPNYYKAGPWILTVDEDGNAKIYDAKPSESDSNVLVKVREDDEGTPLGSTEGEHSIELTTTISDRPFGYELPHTGGTGTQMYTLGGLLLIAAAGLLAYSRRKRRKKAKIYQGKEHKK